MTRVLLFIFLAVLSMVMIGCLHDIEINESPRHFILKDPDENMSIDLTWQVNDHADGHNYIDLDLYFSDTLKLTEETFILAARYPSKADWRNQPVLIFSVGSRNPKETIRPSKYEHGISDMRKYLGIAINGRGERYSELTGPINIEYKITINLNETTEEITGSITYNPTWLNKTVVTNVASCDIDGLYNFYAFRLLDVPKRVIRSSDFTFTNQIDVSPSGSRTQQNDRLVAALDWSVNKSSPGYDHIDLDMHSGIQIPNNLTGKSDNPDAYEKIYFNTLNIADFSREIGHKLFENLKPGNPVNITIQYTYSVYFIDNPFHRFTISGTILSPPTNASSSIYKALSFTKTGNIVTVSP
jgi:hypothetical protein